MSGLDPQLELVLASFEEKRARDEVCYAAWGKRLSLAQFIEREDRLRATPFARGGMRTWLLIERGDARRRVLSSLETFRVRSRHGLRPGHSHAVASVFTEDGLRGRGYAARLLDEVGARLDLPGAQAMTLYSDVGERAYARSGYVGRAAEDWIFSAAIGHVAGVERSDGDQAVAAALARFPPPGRYAILPDAAQIGWHRAREAIYADLLGAPTLEHGVLWHEDGVAILAGDLKEGCLRVLEIEARSQEAARRLLEACADEAARAGLPEVVCWAAIGGHPVLDEAFAAHGAGRVPRDGSLPMLRPLGGARVGAAAWTHVSRALWV